jgi:alpha/beta superfamily hydrolase
MPTWIKPAVWGAVCGSILTMIVGFSYGGWVTGGTANRLAIQQADAAVTAALVPVCVAHSKADAAAPTRLAELRAMTSSYEQQQFVTKVGWATLPGDENPNASVAEACASALLKMASN